jgi:vWA domain found in the FtsH ternary systems/N-terminal helical region fused to the FtsH ternary system vWA domain
VKRVELRKIEDARDYLLAGLMMTRTVELTPALFSNHLNWLYQVVSRDELSLPPAAVISDLGQIMIGDERSRVTLPPMQIPAWPTARAYDDFVLGKLDNDWTIERATDAIRQYEPADRPRGLSYVVHQIVKRVDITTVSLSPAIVRNMLKEKPSELMERGRELVATQIPDVLITQYGELIASFRRMAELLGPDDIAALEQRTALAELGQYVAHRQIVQLVQRLQDRLPTHAIRPTVGRRDVATKVMDENVYPVGGYSSIGTKGTIESLLHSQLAFLEPGRGPDLFAIRYVRDELFYYTRDENQFLRRRRTFVLIFDESLTRARTKDLQSPVQRIVFLLSAVVVLIRKLEDWLATDALSIELIVPENDSLSHEVELLNVLLRDSIERKSVMIRPLSSAMMRDELDRKGRQHDLHALMLGWETPRIDRDGVIGNAIQLAEAYPIWVNAHGGFRSWTDDDSETAWTELIFEILGEWI